jgi:hypothetical protein
MREVNLGSGYTDEEVGFLKAVMAYQRVNRRRFPTYTEVLAVAKSLGYRRVADPGPLPRYDPKADGAPPSLG